jgi:endonuclease/exonuclease/phosphatase (EEP) superfamily protein YafD
MNEKSSAHSNISSSLWRIVTLAGALLCVATLFGFAGRQSWFLDLFSHFRVQYLVLLTLSGIVLLAARHHKTASIFLVFALINLVQISPLYLEVQKTPPANSMTLRVALINVNTKFGDAAKVSEFIRKADPDLLVLQETSSKWLKDLAWLHTPYPHSLAEPRDDNFGIAVFSKLPFARSEVVNLLENGVPSIIAEVTTQHGELHILATHPLPPVNYEYARWRNAQLEQLPRYVNATKPTLLIGDLNLTPWSSHFRMLLQQTGLHDSARGFGVQPSWPNNNPFLRIPLDHVLHSPGIVVLHREIGPDVKSDHFPLIVDIAVPQQLAATDSLSKVELDMSGLDKDGLRGPSDGKVAVSYEFCIPDNDVCRAEIKAIDQTVQFMPGSRGRIGAGKGECLCIGSTHQENFKQVLRALSEKTYISRIIECHFE